ncbi:hypothetical protein [Viridibacterium curvum]|uniref:Class I SAM-dependent methyltransferase n=1 Tax=Viridibacterium curvum TaxID=1101404 RepID=A0ABP9R0K8_9RHOO
MTLRDHWLHESGGLVWHWRALRHRQSLWSPFCHTVAGWLDTWAAPRDKLLIIGPSAGYTLGADWLHSWGEVAACEPDPFARWLLQRRMARHIHFHRINVFAPGGLRMLVQAFPHHALLFSNVLGQCAPRDATAARWYADLHAALRGHHWASYHDVASSNRAPDKAEPAPQADAASLESVLAQFWQGGELAITDHGTFGLGLADPRKAESPLLERAFAVWRLRPDQHHLVEWLSHVPT